MRLLKRKAASGWGNRKCEVTYIGTKGADKGKVCHYTFYKSWSCGTVSNDNDDPKNCYKTQLNTKIGKLPKLGV
jgi:hypothetical protein